MQAEGQRFESVILHVPPERAVKVFDILDIGH